jgi:Phage capsid protein
MTQYAGPEQWMLDIFADNVRHAMQQSESVLSGCVLSGSMAGKKKRHKYLGSIEMNETLGLRGDTNWVLFDFLNRWCSAKSFDISWLNDKDEIEKLLTDPNSDFVKAVLKAAKRQKDRTIIGAFNGIAYTGEEAQTPISFLDSRIIDIQFGDGAANVGLNLAKIKRCKYIFDRLEVPEEDRFFGHSAYQLDEMLDVEQMTNADYANVKALNEGKIDKFLGFTFKRTEMLPMDKDNDIRTNFAWVKDCMQLDVSREINIKSAVVPTKNFNVGTQADMRIGAVRLCDEGVIEIPCKEIYEDFDV